MKIYVIEMMCDYTTQIGWTTSEQIAKEKCEEISVKLGRECWIREYQIGKKNWCEFDCDQ